MRSFFRVIATACISLTLCFAQQASSPKPQNQKKQAAAPAPAEPAENAAKPETPEQRPPASQANSDKDRDKEKDKDKEEHFDMTEVPPVVTHHQITVDGKLLKYTATAGRLPIKRGDGKIEA